MVYVPQQRMSETCDMEVHETVEHVELECEKYERQNDVDNPDGDGM